MKVNRLEEKTDKPRAEKPRFIEPVVTGFNASKKAVMVATVAPRGEEN